MKDNDDNDSRERPEAMVISLLGPSEKHSVLLVDDEDLIRRAFARDLKSLDLDVTLARTGVEGLDRVREKTFSVVISDFHMPGMDGITFLEEVSGISPDSVRILVSGRGDFNMAIDVINRVGLFSFIPKPWVSNSLRDTVRRATEHYAITLENRRLNGLLGAKCDELSCLAKSLEHEVQERTSSLLFGLINALDLRDTETQWHSRRVAAYARRLAEQLGIVRDDLLAIERGALLHDVGKIGVSDTILLKPGKLTTEEWEEMKRHSQYGYHILEDIEFLGDARQLVWEHHEVWSGKGYPRGLAGEDIYIGARVFGVIDAYDAMTSDRPYRKAMSHETACQEIIDKCGSQFDPTVVNAWQKITKEELFGIRDEVARVASLSSWVPPKPFFVM